MSDEIKEILDRLDFNEWEVDLYKVPITWCELYTIRDYITNLQQELDTTNEKWQKDKQFYNCRLEENVKLRKEKEHYKSRAEKAIEYINKFESIRAYYEYIDEDGYDEYNYDEDFKEDLLELLQGGKDER